MHTILTIDDDSRIRNFLVHSLRSSGYRVLSAKNGLEGLLKLEQDFVDLVLLDFDMPGLTGANIIQLIRETRSALTLPVVFVTGRSDQSDVVSCLSLGANDYVTKPINFPILLARIQTQLGLRTEAAIEKVNPLEDNGVSSKSVVHGAVINQRYRIQDLIGEGGFAKVFRAEQLSTGQVVAIKLLHSRNISDRSVYDRFSVEQRILAKISHPNIVKLIDAGVFSDNARYVVMEHIEGVNLDEYLRSPNAILVCDVIGLLSQILDGLSSAHRAGIVHADLKPGNIMVSETGARPHAHILDFGISTLSSTAHHPTRTQEKTEETQVFGTPQYMAPEQLLFGKRTIQSDLYAWGLIALEAFTGNPPFQGLSPLAICVRYQEAFAAPESYVSSISTESVPSDDLKTFLTRITSIDASMRPASADEALAEFESATAIFRGNPVMLDLGRVRPTDVQDTEKVDNLTEEVRTAHSTNDDPLPKKEH